MLPKDFRGYLDYLESKGKLCRVKKEVDVKYEVAAGIRKTSDIDGPALLFENIKGFPGWRMAGGIFATKKLMALALETEPDEEKILARYLACDQQRVKPKLLSTGPVKEIIIKGKDVDLYKLPIPTYNEKDGGPFIITCAEYTKHPDTGLQNVSIERRQVFSKDMAAVGVAPWNQNIIINAAWEAKGKGMEVATVIGCPPEISIASQIKAPLGVDETEIAGALRGEPIEMVKCETVDLEVPAHAEIIIEGVTSPGERVIDGPFGEWPGNYMSGFAVRKERFVGKITAITMRKNPIFQAMATGKPMTENQWLRKWSLAAAAYRLLVNFVPVPSDLKGVNVTEGGSNATFVVSIHKRFDRTPLNMIYALLSANFPVRNCIVVDDDINIYDPKDVEWAQATRVMPERSIVIHQGVHAQANPPFKERWGIDATAPIKDREWYIRAVPPGVDKVDYI